MNSLRQILSEFGNVLQTRLFPVLEQELGELTAQHKTLVQTLAALQMDRFVAAGRKRGRPQHNRANILRALVAKAVLGIPHTRALLQRLQSDVLLRRLCGWEGATHIPEESVFSRAFAEFAASELLQQVHAGLIQRSYAEQLVGHISRDASAIPAREKPQPKSRTPRRRASRRKHGRQPEEMTRLERQSLPGTTLEQMLAELPRCCDKGSKKDSKGLAQFWIGYKLHLDVADGGVPISCLLTSASLHDSQAAIPLTHLTAGRVTNLYDLMDSAYDAHLIRACSEQLGHVPIIDPLKRGHQDKPVLAPHQQVRLRQRTGVERVYARLKDEFGGRFVRVRGGAKVMAHLMFGILALTVDQLLRLAPFTDTPLLS
jgi:transposase